MTKLKILEQAAEEEEQVRHPILQRLMTLQNRPNNVNTIAQECKSILVDVLELLRREKLLLQTALVIDGTTVTQAICANPS